MRRILSLCLLLALSWPCHAQQKPNTLTPKEITDGWISLFDGETTFGWASEGKAVNAGNGALEIGGKQRTVARQILAHLFPAFEMTCEMMVEYRGKKVEGGAGGFHLEFANGTSVGRFDGPPKEGTPPTWKKHRLLAKGGRCIWDDGGIDDGMGLVGVSFGADADTILRLRNVKFRPMNTVSLFNGTDLTGWREFPGKKSKFAVIDGAINVKDGPGDLQTVGKYNDFILQLECKSNGKHLNSGIFFRCRDNEYQNGYESQILNKFTAEATQKYLIAEYDSKTNKLIGKKETLFTAVDYGTGAIYNRQPARKQMAKDGEWFGMTIVAHGNHFATWVNGVQVTDWYDNRPNSDNARKGCKLEAGHISIQGHDPTTDLSFKNIRIAEFK